MAKGPSLRDLIKEARKKKGWTQESLGSAMGLSRSAIAGLESGVAPTEQVRQRLIEVLGEPYATAIQRSFETAEALKSEFENGRASPPDNDDMIDRFMSLRRSRDVDLSGQWNAMWLTTTNGVENRNRELINVRRRWNSTWEFSNVDVSEDNPDGGYLWIARLELFDNKHILGHYCAKDASVLAKGTLCLELQSNGRDVLGVWHGLNFDTMWANGLVAMSRTSSRNPDPKAALDRFIKSRPKMPY